MGPVTIAILVAAQALPATVPVPSPPPIIPVEPPVLTPAAPRAQPPRGPRAASPRGNPGNWANANDYPTRALREELQGTTRFRLIVSADGRTTHCEVRESSGSLALDQTTCAIIKRRARFTPALSPSGTAIEGSWSSAVRWQIPRDSQPPLVAMTSVKRFVVTAEGGLASCGQSVAGLVQTGSDQACDPTQAYVPFRDKKGQVAARQVTITTTRTIADAE